MSFEEAHTAFLVKHTEVSTGERKRRLQQANLHAETLFLKQVWWPLVGDLNHLHPEHEVLDWRGRSYYADFAWLPGYVKLLVEIKGYASHVRDMDRHKYCHELNRETFLHGIGYQVISFAYDDVKERPELCMTLLRMVLSRYRPRPSANSRLLLAEEEVLRFACALARPIRPVDLAEHLDISGKSASQLLMRLGDKGWFTPVTGTGGIRKVAYRLVVNVTDVFP
ncbi:hypothetical protein [Gorillibacterium sp. sgz5001074]|uniref:hypothetical protein n=1 Tax=Gorillibacterium sp. sgz5001074 TaxID=3446695 RepID=UPI003F66FD10